MKRPLTNENNINNLNFLVDQQYKIQQQVGIPLIDMNNNFFFERQSLNYWCLKEQEDKIQLSNLIILRDKKIINLKEKIKLLEDNYENFIIEFKQQYKNFFDELKKENDLLKKDNELLKNQLLFEKKKRLLNKKKYLKLKENYKELQEEILKEKYRNNIKEQQEKKINTRSFSKKKKNEKKQEQILEEEQDSLSISLEEKQSNISISWETFDQEQQQEQQIIENYFI